MGTRWVELRSEQQVEEVLRMPRALVFKHSTRCSVSRRAYSVVEQFTEEHPEIPLFLVSVIESRPVSNYLAEQLKVRHQSPQVLLVCDGEAVWHGEHYAISGQTIGEAVAKANGPAGDR